MGRKQEMEELMKIRDQMDRLPRFKGKSSYVRKVTHAINHMRRYKETYGSLFVKEARADLAKARAEADAAYEGREVKE